MDRFLRYIEASGIRDRQTCSENVLRQDHGLGARYVRRRCWYLALLIGSIEWECATLIVLIDLFDCHE